MGENWAIKKVGIFVALGGDQQAHALNELIGCSCVGLLQRFHGTERAPWRWRVACAKWGRSAAEAPFRVRAARRCRAGRLVPRPRRAEPAARCRSSAHLQPPLRLRLCGAACTLGAGGRRVTLRRRRSRRPHFDATLHAAPEWQRARAEAAG